MKAHIKKTTNGYRIERDGSTQFLAQREGNCIALIPSHRLVDLGAEILRDGEQLDHEVDDALRHILNIQNDGELSISQLVVKRAKELAEERNNH